MTAPPRTRTGMPRPRPTRGSARPRAVIGLLGGIGSGKSTVARILAEAGARVADADILCRELQETPEIKKAIRGRWGDRVFAPDGSLDRARLAEIVFRDADELDALNRMIHPGVVRRIRREITACRPDEIFVIDAPLLLESGLIDLCDVVLFVECDPGVRARRAAEARGWSEEEIRRREAQQAPLARKRQAADFVIHNDGDEGETRRQIQDILTHL